MSWTRQRGCFYLGKWTTYQVAINLLVAVEPEIGDLTESEQVELIKHGYAPGRIMSYRSRSGKIFPFGYVDVPDTEHSEARQNLERLVEALPELRPGIGGGGGPFGIVDPQELSNFFAVVREVAETFMHPITVGVLIHQVNQYLDKRRDAKEEEHDKEVRTLKNRVAELEAKLPQEDGDERIERLQVADPRNFASTSSTVEEEKL